MIKVRFLTPDGDLAAEAVARPGDRLLEIGQANGMPLEGTCEGQMACSTCHVIVEPGDFARLATASEEEEDMLDLAVGATRTSRLSCQVVLDDSLDGLCVRLPSEHRDMQGR